MKEHPQSQAASSPCKGEDQGGGLKFRRVDSELLRNAKELRKNPTEAEKRLWYYLSSDSLKSFRFRRQHPIDHYIVDFVCLKQKLVIELDGGQHALNQEYDAKRTDYLEKKGFHVIRFWNNEIVENMEGVYFKILQVLGVGELTPTPPSPLQGEGAERDCSLLKEEGVQRNHLLIIGKKKQSNV